LRRGYQRSQSEDNRYGRIKELIDNNADKSLKELARISNYKKTFTHPKMDDGVRK